MGGEAGRLYRELRNMAITFQFPPGQRINEVELARKLSTSRTPLREALSRLASEELLTSLHGRGFFCRSLDPQSIYNLYEYRRGLECWTVRLACQRASDEAIKGLGRFLDETADVPEDENLDNVLHFDERFHESIAESSGNVELLKALRNLNARIFFVRWIAMRGKRVMTQSEHRQIVTAMRKRDETKCVALMEKHIARRMDQIVAVVREGYSTIYMREATASGAEWEQA